MKTVDLTKLIEGLIAVLLLALAIGKYDVIQAFARREAAASLRGWDSHVFFSREYQQILQEVPGYEKHRRRKRIDSKKTSRPRQANLKDAKIFHHFALSRQALIGALRN